MSHVVYTVFNRKNNKIYIGQTSNLSNRLKLHENGIFHNSYTARFDGGWDLIYKEEVANCNEALIREKQLKSFRGREFVKKFIPA
ncbi:MAG TPA: GIY-YIG nuclease family protein [Candidatus Paceibacterota bacterium]